MASHAAGGPVVLAQDDPEVLARIRDALRADDLLVVGCRTARAAFEAVDFHRPAAVVVDVAMEEGRGWELLFYAVSGHGGTATVVLDRLGDPLVRRGAIAACADDVVAAPFDAEEVAGRVRTLLRRQEREPRGGPVYRHGDLVVDVPAHEVRVGGRPVVLTPQQFGVLRALCEAGGATLHRSQLIARIAAVDDEPPSDRAVDLHVSRLRHRLGDGGPARYVEAVYGIGYRLAPANADAPPIAGAAEVLEALPEALVVVDERLAIRAVNRSAEIMLGRSRGELLGRGCGEVLACRTCAGAPLAGPACLGRAVLAGDVGIRHARALATGADGPLPVVFSHVPVVNADGSRSVAISIRPDRA